MNDDELEELYKTIVNVKVDFISTASTNSVWYDTKISNSVDLFSNEWIEEWRLAEEWKTINTVAKNNESLQKAIERVKILYYLSKEDGNSKT